MSDSEKTDELDNYGVRIKKDGDTAQDASGAALTDFSLDADLPDLASFDDVIADSPETSVEEDISLDEFIVGGEFEDVAEGNRGYGQAEAPAEPATSGDESVALDDFLDLSSLDDAPAAAETAPAMEDAPLDIDLSFDDGSDTFMTETATASIADEPAAETTGTGSTDMESIDLDAFGFDDGETPAAEAPASDEPAVTETSAASFDDMFNALDNGGTLDASAFFDDEPSATPAESTPVAEPTAASGEESVDLADFGFDADSTENQGEVKDGAKKTGGQEDYEMTVTVDDDSPQPLTVPQASVPVPADQNVPADNDVELDDLLNNVTDENGNTVQVGEETAPAATETTETAAEQPAAQAEPNPAATALLSKIVGELDALRGEIAQLKNDFAEMKNKGIPEATAQPDQTEQTNPCDSADPSPSAPPVMDANDFFDSNETGLLASFAAEQPDDTASTDDAPSETVAEETPEIADEAAEETAFADIPEIPAPEQTEPETGGFFDDNNDDEIISLSTDELSNILNNAEVQTETIEAEQVAEPMAETGEDDFSFDTIEQGEASDLPEEISVPKTDEAAEPEPAETLDEIDEIPMDTVPPAESEIAPAQEEQPLDAPASADPADEKTAGTSDEISGNLKQEIKSVLTYMDQLLENLPEDKITEFAQSEQFEAYKKLFKDLGLA